MSDLHKMVTDKIAIQKKLFAELYALNLPQEDEDYLVSNIDVFVDTIYMMVEDGAKTMEQALTEKFFVKN